MTWRSLVATCVVCACAAWVAWLGLQWQQSRERERPWIVAEQCYDALRDLGESKAAKECANLAPTGHGLPTVGE